MSTHGIVGSLETGVELVNGLWGSPLKAISAPPNLSIYLPIYKIRGINTTGSRNIGTSGGEPRGKRVSISLQCENSCPICRLYVFLKAFATTRDSGGEMSSLHRLAVQRAAEHRR